jgi:glycosyltransferase involved in cell wall biosynthesis
MAPGEVPVPVTGFEKGVTVVLYFGVVAERRGIFDVLDVFSTLSGTNHPSAFLVIGPVDKKDRNLFFERIASESLKGRVRYIPWIDMSELQAYLDIADICIAPFHKNPQHESGVANKIFDYMLGGLPVIASDCGPQKKLIEKCRCGMIYANKEQMKEAIITLSADPALRKEMGENGKKAILSEYNITIKGKVLADLYAGLKTVHEIND